MGIKHDFHSYEHDERYAYLSSLAEAKGWPIIQIKEETNTDFYHEEIELDEYVPDFGGSYSIDTKLITEGEDGRTYIGGFDYTGHILEAALLGKTIFCTSRKYSFGDTPAWWTPFTPVETEGREVLQIEVQVNY